MRHSSKCKLSEWEWQVWTWLTNGGGHVLSQAAVDIAHKECRKNVNKDKILLKFHFQPVY